MAVMSKKFKGILTKEELAHLRADGLDSVVMFRRVREEHRKAIRRSGYEPCEVCRGIAVKLGWED